MRVSTSQKPASTSSRRSEAQRLPPLYVNSALSRKIDKAIVDPDSKRERQLKFTTRSGFVSPAGNPLQVVYLSPPATKSGLDITYVDAKAKQFWAQAPGVSGLARGPFALPAAVGPALAKLTANELKAEAKDARPKRAAEELVFHPTAEQNAAIRHALSGSPGTGGFVSNGSGGTSGGGVGWGS